MIYCCRSCNHLKRLDDAAYGRLIRCEMCGAEHAADGCFHPERFDFVYKCDCGVTQQLSFNVLGKKAKCPNCSTVNAVGAVYLGAPDVVSGASPSGNVPTPSVVSHAPRRDERFRRPESFGNALPLSPEDEIRGRGSLIEMDY